MGCKPSKFVHKETMSKAGSVAGEAVNVTVADGKALSMPVEEEEEETSCTSFSSFSSSLLDDPRKKEDDSAETEEGILAKILEDAERILRKVLDHNGDDKKENHNNGDHDAKRRRRSESTDEVLASALVELSEEESKKAYLRRKLAMSSKEEVRESLHSCQRQALEHVEKETKQLHQDAMPGLLKRVQELGFKPEALGECLAYIQLEAPIVIHLTEATLAKLVKDTHYRNMFETNKSGGCNDTSARKGWERKLFGSAYDGRFDQPKLRPKYGCLNVTGDISGVRPARTYGSLFMTLAPHVRHRATFSEKDTSSKDCSIATNEFYAHTLAKYTDNELKAVLNVSRIGGAESKCSNYKEVQIHGPICLETDIQALSVPGSENSAGGDLLLNVYRFQEKTGCNILWMDELLGVGANDDK